MSAPDIEARRVALRAAVASRDELLARRSKTDRAKSAIDAELLDLDDKIAAAELVQLETAVLAEVGDATIKQRAAADKSANDLHAKREERALVLRGMAARRETIDRELLAAVQCIRAARSALARALDVTHRARLFAAASEFFALYAAEQLLHEADVGSPLTGEAAMFITRNDGGLQAIARATGVVLTGMRLSSGDGRAPALTDEQLLEMEPSRSP